MSDTSNPRNAAALKKLADHLTALRPTGAPALPMEHNMLSLLVSGVLNGENLPQQYPALHRELLANAELRQAFLDALELLEAERAGSLTPVPAPETRLDFLQRPAATPQINISTPQHWQIAWQKTIAQLQAIFSPPELAYRAEQALFEEPWFTLLRDEISVEDLTYTVSLDCALAPEAGPELAAYLSLAVTPASASPAFPLIATLQWGAYQQSTPVATEGRVRFPNIPLATIYDSTQTQINAELSLTLATPA